MSRRPRLLFVAPWFLFPRVSGGRIRTTDVLRGMKGGHFEITVAGPAPADGRDWRAELDAVCDRFAGWPDDTDRSAIARLRHLLSRLPVSVALDRSRAARRAVAAELGRGPDVAVFDFVHTAVLAPARLDLPSVVFTHNVESEIYRRNAAVARGRVAQLVWRSQSAKMERFERAALRRFDAVVAVSDRDGDCLREMVGADRVHVIPTGVDVAFHAFSPKTGTGDLVRPGATLVFTGSMRWPPNVDGLEWLMDEVWPLLAARSPRTRLRAVGRDPSPHLVASAGRRGLPWTFTGFVDDVRPYVRAADVCVVPIRTGGGTRLKVYEAMALGCPVVATGVGVEGLPVEAGTHYLRADTAGEFASAILRLLADPGQRRRMTEAARSFVAGNFSAEAVGRAFEAVCRKVAGGVTAGR